MATPEKPKSGDPVGTREKMLLATGAVTKAGPYGNSSASSGAQSFGDAAQAASKAFSGAEALSGLKNLSSFTSLIPAGSFGNKKPVTVYPSWVTELQRIARKMVDYGSISYEAAEKFLYLLIAVDDLEVMKKIAQAVQVSELAEPRMLNNAGEILAIPKLYEAAFLAEAIYAIINAYSKYISLYNHQQGNIGNSQMSLTDLLGMVTGGLGGFGSIGQSALSRGASPNASTAENILGNNLTKVILGKEIPMGIQANNPMLQSPSIVGKMMFGESPSGTAVMDMKQLFAKPIAVFSQMQGGAGSKMFNFKNVGSLKAPQSLNDIVAKSMFGSTSIPSGGFAGDILKQVQTNVADMLGTSGLESVDMTRADNAIPISAALSDSMSGISDKLPEINREFRNRFLTLTKDKAKIDEIFRSGLDYRTAADLGLNYLTSEVPINIKNIGSVFPTEIFSRGFQDVLYAEQVLRKSGSNFTKVLELI